MTIMYAELLEKVKALVLETAQIAEVDHAHSIIQKGKQDFVTDVDLTISSRLCEQLPLPDIAAAITRVANNR